MQVIYQRCCGRDVHKKVIAACVLLCEERGRKRKELRTFGTMTRDLLALADWLQGLGVEQVAMESTGVYWKPVWNILEGQLELLLVNAQQIKAVPGRKTGIQDCEWIADLLQHGLLRRSFVPEPAIRELRDVTRYRATLAQERATVANRIQKVLEDANMKLASVATDVLGQSGRSMWEAMVAGQQDPEQLAELARRRLRAKIPQLRAALPGRIQEHHRFLLRRLVEHLRFVESPIAELEEEMERRRGPFQEAVSRWTTIPGVEKIVAWSLVAEIGTRMEQFPSAQHLASWAGVCPGNHESAGKRRSGATPRGNPWLRRVLCQAAGPAARTKGTYLSAPFHRRAARRGRKRAIIAVAHSLLVIAYGLLRQQCDYRELGGDSFDRLHAEGLKRHLLRRLTRLGYKATLEPLESPTQMNFQGSSLT